MGQSKIVIALIAVLIVLGWGSAVLSITDGSSAKEYEEHLSLAEQYVERELYQKAILEYESALEIESSDEVWDLVLQTYEYRYEEDSSVYSDYVEAAQSAVAASPDNVDFLLDLHELYMIKDNYEDSFDALTQAVEDGMDEEEITALLLEVTYVYDVSWKNYSEYRYLTNGYYAVNNSGVWSYIQANGDTTDWSNLSFASSVGYDDYRIVDGEIRVQVLDENEIAQGNLDFTPVDAGVYAEGLIAISDGDSFSYYDSLGDKQFGRYSAAGTFTGGEAAVQQNDVWYLIDDSGEKVSNETYDDIILNEDGSHIKSEVMIVKSNGSYKFINDGDSIASFDDADLITDDEIVAVCIDGSWCFVDLEGEEVLDGNYEQAKSFSNGLAAVYNGELWGFIDEEGTLVIDYTFFDAGYFNTENCCMVQIEEDSWVLIDLYLLG